MYGEIKIIGGRFKGKKIKVLETKDLRPTPNRVREAIFSSLQYAIPQARCLDAFAGTGAMGLEALSRGAKEVVFIENNKLVYSQLKKNLASFPQNQIKTSFQDALDYLSTTPHSFDLIFLDPPFHQALWLKCCELIETRQLLQPGGLVYLEAPHPLNLPYPNWEQIKTKQMADVFYTIYLVNSFFKS